MKGMVTNMWAYESVFYQIYPMGFCGVPFENDGVQRHEIKRVEDWIPHMQKLGVNAVYFSPVFESDTHGYNTRDYRKIDVRLGTNEDFKEVCDALHVAGIRVVLDGVFNHVGRGFAQFQDVIRNRENSPYVNWFYRIDFVTRTYPQKLELADEFAPFREVMVNTYCNMIENGSSYWYEVVNS